MEYNFKEFGDRNKRIDFLSECQKLKDEEVLHSLREFISKSTFEDNEQEFSNSNDETSSNAIFVSKYEAIGLFGNTEDIAEMLVEIGIKNIPIPHYIHESKEAFKLIRERNMFDLNLFKIDEYTDPQIVEDLREQII